MVCFVKHESEIYFLFLLWHSFHVKTARNCLNDFLIFLPPKNETVLLADFMPKTPYFWHPVSVKLWPFFEFQVSFSETAVKLLTVSREFSKCRLPAQNR